MSHKVSVILLAGGQGNRFGSSKPKQFLSLLDKPIIRYPFDLFASLEEVIEIIIVCNPAYQSLFPPYKNLRFAKPGKERQDSVYNGFKLCSHDADLICIHDGVRPFITEEIIRNCFQAAKKEGAAIVAVPTKSTIKVSSKDRFITHTPDRSTLWEAQTPQMIAPHLLDEAFQKTREKKSLVTDDASLIEQIGHRVKLVKGCYTNIKITTPEDWKLAESIALDLYATL